jgi:DNA-directed RNA polymerase I subunit RPA2
LTRFAGFFRFDEDYTAVDHFGKQLVAAGYNYWGNEPMYSGITGQEFAADIYLGVVYYQRLRHMVNDKFQVRTTGPVDQVTRQPIKVSYLLSAACKTAQETDRSPRVANVVVVSDSEKWSATL